MTTATVNDQRRLPEPGNIFNNVFQNSLQRFFQDNCIIANHLVHRKEQNKSTVSPLGQREKNTTSSC